MTGAFDGTESLVHLEGFCYMSSEAWQDTTSKQIQEWFAAALDVQAVALFGSSKKASALRDEWSDIDVIVVVETDALPKYHPNIDWVKTIGEVYTYEQSSTPFTFVTRCCFRDGRRVDFVFATLAAIETIDEWPQLPWWEGSRILFSRSEALSALLGRTSVPPAPPLMNSEAFATMTHSFRFKGMLAVSKIVRNDLLIALHLVLEMQQDCCVLGMILRDRAEGTSHHRSGGIGNSLVTELQASQFAYTISSLLDGIERMVLLFDNLAAQWTGEYRPDPIPLLNAVAKARNIELP